MPVSEGSDSVVEKETLGLRSTSEVSNVVLTDGCVILCCSCKFSETRSTPVFVKIVRFDIGVKPVQSVDSKWAASKGFEAEN